MLICMILDKFEKNLAERVGKSEKNLQLNLFKEPLVQCLR